MANTKILFTDIIGDSFRAIPIDYRIGQYTWRGAIQASIVASLWLYSDLFIGCPFLLFYLRQYIPLHQYRQVHNQMTRHLRTPLHCNGDILPR